MGFPLKTPYAEYQVKCQWGQYPCGQTALTLVSDPEDPEDDSPIGMATVAVPQIKLPEPDLVIIKTWSENEGTLESLVAAGILEDTGRKIPLGYVEASVCRVLKR